MAVTDWSTTPASNNAAPPTGAPEGMAPSAVNDVMRQMMADIRVFYNNTALKDAANTFTAAAAATASLSFAPNGGSSGTAVLATIGVAGAIVNDSAAGDIVLRTTSHAIRLCVDGGTATALGVTSAGVAQYGGVEIGYRGIPVNTQNTNYTLVLTDAGKMILCTTTGGFTWTIPANASVAYPVGTVLTFINDSAGANTIAITTDTMRLAGTTSTGSRTLATIGMATAVKMVSTEWIISGSGLS